MRTPVDPTQAAAVAATIAAQGWAVVDSWLPPAHWTALADACRAHAAAGRLAAAAVGRGANRRHEPSVRGDRTRWLDAGDPVDSLALMPLAALREALARELLLPLAAEEAHYALYPPGAGYARHVDRFRDDDARLLSAVLYLNAGWQASDGGALRLHGAAGDGPRDIAPQGGRLVVFRADGIEHEVLPSTRDRLSIATWLRRA